MLIIITNRCIKYVNTVGAPQPRGQHFQRSPLLRGRLRGQHIRRHAGGSQQHHHLPDRGRGHSTHHQVSVLVYTTYQTGDGGTVHCTHPQVSVLVYTTYQTGAGGTVHCTHPQVSVLVYATYQTGAGAQYTSPGQCTSLSSLHHLTDRGGGTVHITRSAP